ncbi:MAG: Recombination protein RecR [Microgenomates group bacterium GW2011_GWF2_45_18]|nr:MAG: Recombination protein RecR [Microgenomates group bacterium GW2011_GWF1_44_10]KKU01417.1 MAG: Recombination protein RecR [Microgenomates group bacterium GW2011_GWF2_45_18]OGJ41495.1 MAG: recombination protein RecR [Candidatus Pacebacteria bacterium RIFOXYB1_FULL_44_10]HAU98867.1 recombination protein RecR [Candidatus Paceibacterota bacterium]HAX01175.1 recombination protein RecR [Candidatus Paceibacterota bacterium]
MLRLPKPLQTLIEQFERLPGIGPKSAQRIVFYLLHVPEPVIRGFADALIEMKTRVVLCEQCHLVSESTLCSICADESRDQTQMCVVEQPLDALAIERAGSFHGVYHVLHGAIAPLNNIGPEQLYLLDISKRLEGIDEIIIATNPTMEGESTALYIQQLLLQKDFRGTVSRIGHGLPIGADIEYADGLTLSRALEGRRKMGE